MEKEKIDYNSDKLSSEKIFLYLKSGKRIPQNKFEEEFLKECKEIEAKGGVVYIPHSDMI